MTRILAILAALLLLAAPVAAVEQPPNAAPPIGTVVFVIAVSDGTTVLPVGTTMIPPQLAAQMCLETGETP